VCDGHAEAGTGTRTRITGAEVEVKLSVLRPDFDAGDLATMIGAMSKVIAMSNGDDAVWRRHLGFVLDGLRGKS
jgi:hypothetical protein